MLPSEQFIGLHIAGGEARLAKGIITIFSHLDAALIGDKAGRA
jgi:hypothetical protein